MKINVLLLLVVLALALFLVGCAEETVTEAEAEADLEGLSEDELLDVIASDDSGKAIAGEASRRRIRGRTTTTHRRVAVRQIQARVNAEETGLYVDENGDFTNENGRPRGEPDFAYIVGEETTESLGCLGNGCRPVYKFPQNNYLCPGGNCRPIYK